MPRRTGNERDFRLGEWLVQPSLGRITGPAGEVQLEPRAMELLVFLAAHAGRVVSRQEIIDAVWQQEFVGDAAISGAVAKLRRALGDDVRSPRFIETIAKRGYRLTDVHPDGKSILITDGIQRARMSEGCDHEYFLTPGEPTEIEVDMWSTAMVFNAGHRIRVAIAGTNYERFERNSNDGGDLNNPNYIVAHPEILFGPAYPSALLLPLPALFADDFEYGDTGGWSSTVP